MLFVTGSYEILQDLDYTAARLFLNDPTIPNAETSGWWMLNSVQFCESRISPGLWRWEVPMMTIPGLEYPSEPIEIEEYDPNWFSIPPENLGASITSSKDESAV